MSFQDEEGPWEQRVPSLVSAALGTHDATLVVVSRRQGAAPWLWSLSETRRGAGLRAACLCIAPPAPLDTAGPHLPLLLAGRAPTATLLPAYHCTSHEGTVLSEAL